MSPNDRVVLDGTDVDDLIDASVENVAADTGFSISGEGGDDILLGASGSDLIFGDKRDGFATQTTGLSVGAIAGAQYTLAVWELSDIFVRLPVSATLLVARSPSIQPRRQALLGSTTMTAALTMATAARSLHKASP